MSSARKCDRCGAYYDDMGYGVKLSERTDEFHANDMIESMDLCKHCADEVRWFLRKKEALRDE